MRNQWTVSEKPGRYYLRFTLNERIQHLLLMISIFTLIATGMPVRYHNIPTAELVVQWIGGNPIRATLHRLGALLLLFLAFYHLLYLLFTPRGREQFRALLPVRKDLYDFGQMLKYYLGIDRNKPPFGRFSYIEKFEYWAVVWGVAIMGLTGLMLWRPEIAMLIFPKWALDVARVIHSYEALLAFISIIFWHFYNVHFNPAVFPMSTTWIDGLIPEERLKEEHLLEYQQVKDREEEWLSVLPPRGIYPEGAEALLPKRERMIRLIASAWGGILAGASALVPSLPILALCSWLLNPEDQSWSVALRLFSLLILPSSVVGVALSVVINLRGYRVGRSVFASFLALLSFYLSALSLWLILLAGFYVLRWFFPGVKFSPLFAIGLLIASLLFGLAGAFWVWGREQFRRQRRSKNREGTERPSGPSKGNPSGENSLKDFSFWQEDRNEG